MIKEKTTSLVQETQTLIQTCENIFTEFTLLETLIRDGGHEAVKAYGTDQMLINFLGQIKKRTIKNLKKNHTNHPKYDVILILAETAQNLEPHTW